MKKSATIFLIFLIFALGIFSFVEARTTKVRGYYKPRTGSYVQPHYKTSPNKSRFDNWSTKWNYNPYTGKKGTKDPFNTYGSYRFK